MQDSLLYGTLLGDAWIYKQKNKKNTYSFAFCQANKEYAKWKANLLGFPYTLYNSKRFDKRTGKYYENLTIHVKLTPEKKHELYNLFYKPRKSVSKEILGKLTEEAIALWYMDDGNMYYNGNNCHLLIATESLSKEENILIQNYFKDKYDITFTLTTRNNIRLTSKKECIKFMNIVEKYIPECMSYKILRNAIIKYKKSKI